MNGSSTRRHSSPFGLAPTPEGARAGVSALAAAAVLLLALGVALFRISVPVPWSDEAATLSAVGRPLPELWRLLGRVDAAHGLYYSLMWLWVRAVGTNVVALRVASALAFSAAAAVFAHILSRRVSLAAGLMGGTLFVLLPRLAWSAGEARSYAFVALTAVVSTALLLRWYRAPERKTVRVLYTITAAIGLYFSVLTATLLAVHLLATLIWGRGLVAPGLRGPRGLWWRHGLCLAIAGFLALPVLLAATEQSAQVSWIAAQDTTLGRGVFLAQYFLHPRPEAVALCWAFVAAAAFALLRSPRRGLVLFGLLWCVLPTALLAGAQALGKDLYLPRYLIFTAPGAVLVVVLALLAMPWRSMRVLALLAMVALMVPILLSAQAPGGKMGTDYRDVAELVRGSDAVLYAVPDARGIGLASPEPTRSARDVLEDRSPVDSGTLWGTNLHEGQEIDEAALVRGRVVEVFPKDRTPRPLEDALHRHCTAGRSERGAHWSATVWTCR